MEPRRIEGQCQRLADLHRTGIDQARDQAITAPFLFGPWRKTRDPVFLRSIEIDVLFRAEALDQTGPDLEADRAGPSAICSGRSPKISAAFGADCKAAEGSRRAARTGARCADRHDARRGNSSPASR